MTDKLEKWKKKLKVLNVHTSGLLPTLQHATTGPMPLLVATCCC